VEGVPASFWVEEPSEPAVNLGRMVNSTA